MTLASSIGAAAPASSTRSTTVTAGWSIPPDAGAASTAPGLEAGSAVTTLGRTVTIPWSAVNVLRVVSLPPKTLISTTGPPSQVTAVALPRTPRPLSAERAPAMSRPSGPAPTKT
jgi:hypothetical protein